ncbi:phosphoribosylformylglycinamidine synthase subunit PurL [Chondromyces crocatus]|uniref:Phosphoribosylformylglycinamidine synthase subunit PurL n=1 Tax=Chondromyces crocatus TaxID=52 RepID=A0A0K1ES28_CHOCO|nr:phosphoribosylformylglycinamidine synthase subunit PurL [Chondromyces crocatus]AKT43661.1 phosphoribosylglycinamide synthetase [Chondromyces crocatus]
MSTDADAVVPSPAPFPGDPAVDLAQARAHKLSEEEWSRACERLGRAPRFAELGVLSVMWSEHCSYKSSRVHLARLPTTGPRVIQGPGENAGVVDIGDGFAAVFKMESHNHPSFIEPYQGAATGVGGILRDVFTMGARPIANLDSLRFGRPDHPRTAALLRGVVAGVGGYGNCIGVPTVGGELFFDKAYDGNILVNAFTCGVVRADRIFYGRASGVGNPVIYVGARTGRDGIHGATMASDEFSAGGPSKRPTVQVGDPFMEKLLLEACLEIFAEDLLVGIQDMGAAGLTSSSVEMAGRSGSGLELDLDQVPRRAKGLTPYEMLLSESQERMLLVAKPGCEARVAAICEKWELEAAIIGRVTDTGRWVIKATPGYDPLAEAPIARAPVTVCDLPVDFLTDAAPKYDRPQRDDATLPARRAFDCGLIALPVSWSDELLAMVGSPNLGSRQWVWRQYDHLVRGGTEVRPGSDAAVVRVPCERDGERVEKILAFALDCNGRLCELDAFHGAAMAVAEVCRNVVCGGGEPVGLTDCLNFGNPERPEIMRQFALAIDGMAAACRALGVPIVSGNVSLYNETDGRAILPTPTMGAVGLVHDAGDVTRARFEEAGLSVLLLGGTRGGPLGGSEYVVRHSGAVQGAPPGIDLDLERRLQGFLLSLLRRRPRHVLSAHDVSEGGLAVALAECCTAADEARHMVGATIALPEAGEDLAAALFGEAPSRVVVTVRPGDEAEVVRAAGAAGVGVTMLGVTGGSRLSIARGGELLLDVGLDALRAARERCLEGIVGA